MSNVKQVSINGTTYNIGQAYAKQQKTLLNLVGAGCALNSATSGALKIDVKFLKGFLLSVQEEKLDKITDIVFSRTFKSGGDISVCIDDFQGEMSSYLELVAAGIEANLQDFFEYLDAERAAMRPEKAEKSQAV